MVGFIDSQTRRNITEDSNLQQNRWENPLNIARSNRHNFHVNALLRARKKLYLLFLQLAVYPILLSYFNSDLYVLCFIKNNH